VRILELLVEPALSAAPPPGGHGAELKACVKRDGDDTHGDQEIFHVPAPRKTLPTGKPPKRPTLFVPSTPAAVVVQPGSMPQPRRLPPRGDRLGNYAGFTGCPGWTHKQKSCRHARGTPAAKVTWWQRRQSRGKKAAAGNGHPTKMLMQTVFGW